MIRHVLATVVLAGLAVTFGAGCGDSKSGQAKTQTPAKDKALTPVSPVKPAGKPASS